MSWKRYILIWAKSLTKKMLFLHPYFLNAAAPPSQKQEACKNKSQVQL